MQRTCSQYWWGWCYNIIKVAQLNFHPKAFLCHLLSMYGLFFFTVYVLTFKIIFLEAVYSLLKLCLLKLCFVLYFCCRVLLSLVHQSSSNLLSQFPLEPLVNHWGMFQQSTKHEKGNEPRRICPKTHHGKWKQNETTAEIRLEGWEGADRWRRREREAKVGKLWVCWPSLRCQNKINPAAPAPLAGSDCQSISCPITMSEQTN